jgi:MFS family permease
VACDVELTEPVSPAAPLRLLAPPSRPDSRGETRRNLRISTSDGLACSVMVGIGETYLPAFALALGTGQVLAGLIASVPIFAGAVLQLVSPVAIQRIASNRRWVVGCVVVQAISFLPMLAAALIGHISTLLLFLLASLYWGSGLSSASAWNHWIDTLIPERIRARYMGRRTRFTQAGILLGFVGGGAALEFGDALGRPLWAFAVLFLIAGMCRFISAGFLFAQSEPVLVAHRSSNGGLRAAVGRLGKHRDGRLLVYLWVMQMASQSASPFYAPYMLGLLKFSYFKYMLIIAAALVAKAVAPPTLGLLAHRCGARRLLALGGMAIIPLPIFWIFSQNVGYLIFVQILAGACWAAYELGTLLMCFEALDRRERIGMLTLYNLGYATATVVGSLGGGAVLAILGQDRLGYFAIFLLSTAARLATVPLLMRIGAEEKEPPQKQSSGIEIVPAFATAENLGARRAA